MHEEKKRVLLLQALRDVEFLFSCNTMDYSLLLAIHNCTEKRDATRHCTALESRGSESGTPEEAAAAAAAAASGRSHSTLREDFGGVSASDMYGAGVYFFGIIDILQPWDWGKLVSRRAPLRVRPELTGWPRWSTGQSDCCEVTSSTR